MQEAGHKAATMDSSTMEQRFLSNDRDVVEFTAGSQSYSLSFPGKQTFRNRSLRLHLLCMYPVPIPGFPPSTKEWAHLFQCVSIALIPYSWGQLGLFPAPVPYAAHWASPRPGHHSACSGELIWISSFPWRHDANEQAVQHQEAGEATASVRLRGQGPHQESEVRRLEHAAVLLHLFSFRNLKVDNPAPTLLSDPRRPQTFSTTPDSWDRTQIPLTGYAVLWTHHDFKKPTDTQTWRKDHWQTFTENKNKTGFHWNAMTTLTQQFMKKWSCRFGDEY